MKNLILIILLFITLKSHAQSSDKSPINNLPPALSSIRESDLKQDLYTLAGDLMKGRRAGTLDELKGAAWIAQQAQKAGLTPAGDNGTYFQFFPMVRVVVDNNSTIKINGKELKLWKDAWVVSNGYPFYPQSFFYPGETNLNGNILWLSSLADTVKQEIKGSIVAMKIFPPNPLPYLNVNFEDVGYARRAIDTEIDALKRHGAKAIILVADDRTEVAIKQYLNNAYQKGVYGIDDGNTPIETTFLVILVRSDKAGALQQPGANITANLHSSKFIYPSVNVVAEAPGTHGDLKNEYILFSGHHDHDGVEAPVNGDSIWNGADDNASVSVALLAIGRAFVKQPAKRSALFVWHGAEERGLFGSQWYAQHPTIKKENIVAVINADMIGRNNPDSAALLGVTKPHRNSLDLTNAAFKANQLVTHFKIDTTWDNPNHQEYWYYRSDHLPYVLAGIPAIFFTTMVHKDYHTPKDEAGLINYPKLKRMTEWIYTTGWIVANGANRPALDGY
ncbi:MAG: M28 family peptidase [Ginsengibacter sp.]